MMENSFAEAIERVHTLPWLLDCSDIRIPRRKRGDRHMKQFANVLREYTLWVKSFRVVNLLLPYHLYLLFGGVGVLLLNDILIQSRVYWSWILYPIGHYAFFAGIFLTLAAENKKYLPYGLWAYVFYVLFPFKSFTLYQILESAIYLAAGYAFMKFEATEYAK